MEEPDFDDLINYYVQQDFDDLPPGGEEEYYDQSMEVDGGVDQHAAASSSSSNAAAVANSNNHTATTTSTTAALSPTFPSEPVDVDDLNNEDDLNQDHAREVYAERQRRSNTTTDVAFTFERYV
jgi:hypothetical protein